MYSLDLDSSPHLKNLWSEGRAADSSLKGQTELWRHATLDFFLERGQEELLTGIELPTGSMRHAMQGNKIYFVAEKLFSFDVVTQEVELVCDMSKVDVEEDLSQCIPELSDPFYYGIGYDIITRKMSYKPEESEHTSTTENKTSSAAISETSTLSLTKTAEPTSAQFDNPSDVHVADQTLAKMNNSAKIDGSSESASHTSVNNQLKKCQLETRDELVAMFAVTERNKGSLHLVKQCIDDESIVRKKVVRNLKMPQQFHKGIQFVSVPQKLAS